jgi:hypothetical protein
MINQSLDGKRLYLKKRSRASIGVLWYAVSNMYVQAR